MRETRFAQAAVWVVAGLLLATVGPVHPAAGPTAGLDSGVQEGAPTSGFRPSSSPDRACESHPPIVIQGDGGPLGFEIAGDPISDEPVYRPGSGVVGGNGTRDDPYLIAGWCIEPAIGPPRDAPDPPADHAGIRIADTRAHVIIRENVLDGTFRQENRSLGIQLIDAANVTVTENAIEDHREAGIRATGSENLAFRSNLLVDQPRGLAIAGTENVTISDNAIRDHNATGIRIADSGDVAVERNRLRDQDRGIAVTDSRAVDVRSNGLEDGRRGVTIRGGDHVVLEANTIRRHDEVGIRVAGAMEVNVHDNDIQDQRDRGMTIVDAAEVTVASNQFGNQGSGATVVNAHNVSFVRNVIERHRGTGVVLYKQVHGTRVANNTFTRNGHAVQVYRAEGGTVAGNVIRGPDSFGIYHFQSEGTVISNNTIEDADWNALRMQNSNRVAIQDNEMRRTDGAGMRLMESTKIRITGNQLEDNLGAGVRFYDTNRSRVANNTAIRNQVGLGFTSSSSSFPLFVKNTTNVTVVDNEVTDNEVGIAFTRGHDNVVHRNNIEANARIGLEASELDEPLNATMNWWGCPDGPDADACDDVEGHVVYDPWLTESNEEAGEG